jgi:hypothetical protein
MVDRSHVEIPLRLDSEGWIENVTKLKTDFDGYKLRGCADAPADVKIEFCGHCLLQSDVEARDRCLRWLTLLNIDPQVYSDQLEVLARQMSPTRVNTHVYLGLGWKKEREYTTIYLKSRPDLP